MTSTEDESAIGPLASSREVIVFAALTGVAWYNSVELLLTTFLSFKRWGGAYFYCTIASTLGILVYQLNVFLAAFATRANMYGIVIGIGIGWAAMVLGQSLVLWSRLHFLCSHTWKMMLGLCLIIINGICVHSLRIAVSLLAVKDNNLDTHRRSFDMLEKISLGIFSVLEIFLAALYLVWSIRILKATRIVGSETCNRAHLKWLLVASIALITITAITMTLEFLVPWGVRASLKGLMYSLKLKIELAAFKHLKEAATDRTSLMRVQYTNDTIANTRRSMSTWYGSFAWPPRVSPTRPGPGETAKGKQAQKMAVNDRLERADEENIASLQDGPLGGKERSGHNDLQIRYFSEVELEPEKT